ncbi:MAG: aminopeptidase [Candidatus Bathyarchaeota archaeon]|nr:aminopeptidase [Candidatus Bathyarchaeota archaeon]
MRGSPAVEYAYNALTCVMKAKEGEKALIVYDDVKKEVGRVFTQASLHASLYTRTMLLKTAPNTFRTELSPSLKQAISVNPPNLAINLLRGPAEETPFRIKLIASETSENRIRLGHGPGITLDMLTEGALALSSSEYAQMDFQANTIISAAKGAEYIEITTPQGTNVTLSIRGRGFFKDTTITPTKWGNLPTGEVTVGPVEDSLEGKIVCDMAIGGIGPLHKNLTIVCKAGRAILLDGGSTRVLNRVKTALSTDAMASVVGEMAIGLNPKARIVDEFVETEKVYGTAHIAFGRNIDYPTGGANDSANHMDFLMSEPTVVAVFPDEKIELVRDGRIIIQSTGKSTSMT